MIDILFKLEGSMTYTSDEGITTLYGVVHGNGGGFGPAKVSCGMTHALLIRVTAPEILKWIKRNIKEYEKL